MKTKKNESVIFKNYSPLLIIFTLTMQTTSLVKANDVVHYNDIYEYNSETKSDEAKGYNRTAIHRYNQEEDKQLNNDAAHQVVTKIQSNNEMKAKEKSLEEKMQDVRNEIENKRKGYIRKAQRYMRRLNVVMGLYYFHKASKVKGNFDNNLVNFDKFKKELNSQKFDPDKIKNNAAFDRDLSGSLARDADPADLNRDQSTYNFSIEEKNMINKAMKALSVRQKRKVEFDFKKNQILVNKKVMPMEEFLTGKNMATGLPTSSQASFASAFDKMMNKLEKIDQLESSGKSANHLLKNFSVPVGNMGSISQEMNLIVDGIQDDLNADLQAELERKAKEEADAKNLLLSRTPSNVAGMTRDLNGDAIGLSTDSLFLMIKKRYKSEESHGAFQTPQ